MLMLVVYLSEGSLEEQTMQATLFPMVVMTYWILLLGDWSIQVVFMQRALVLEPISILDRCHVVRTLSLLQLAYNNWFA